MVPQYTSTSSNGHRRTLWVLAAAATLVSITQTLVIPIMPRLPGLLGASTSATAWVVTSTLLAGAIATPIAGRLGDMYGKRLVLLVSLMLLGSGSILGALSTDVVVLITARTLQGFAMGVLPLALGIVRAVTPVAQVRSASAVISASLGVGGALGFPLAAFLAEYTDWHILFGVVGVLAGVLVVVVLVFVPSTAVPARARFDALGTVLLVVVLVSGFLIIGQGREWGWTSDAIVSLLVTLAVTVPLWGWWELRTPYPVLDLRSAGERIVLLTNISTVAFGTAMFSMFIIFPQILQSASTTEVGLGLSLLTTGLVMGPAGFAVMLCAPLSARIADRVSPKAAVICGLVTVLAGYCAGIVSVSSVWMLVAVSLIVGAGTGLALGSISALIIAGVAEELTAAAQGVNTLMRSIGTTLSGALIGTVLARTAVEDKGIAVLSAEGVRSSMIIAAMSAGVALLCATCIPRRAGRELESDPLALVAPSLVGQTQQPPAVSDSSSVILGISGRSRAED